MGAGRVAGGGAPRGIALGAPEPSKLADRDVAAHEVASLDSASAGSSFLRIADEAVRLALADRERDAAKHGSVDAADAVDDLEVLKVNRRGSNLRRAREVAQRSKLCSMVSATRLMPTISVAIASAGNSTAHHTPALMNW